MPRNIRIDYPGAMHHIIARGIDGRKAFHTERLKNKFYKRLEYYLKKNDLKCYSWCIMDNHIHLLIQTGKTGISEFMKKLLTSYAVYYNKYYRRKGHLFQNRYKSILCDKEVYLKVLIRYINLNPVKAGKIGIKNLKDYRWTSHFELINDKEAIIRREEVLECFGDYEKEAIKRYVKFIVDGLNLSEDYEGGGLIRSAGGLKEVIKRKKEEKEMYDERILGSGSFVETVLDRYDNQMYEIKRKMNLNELIVRIIKEYKLDKDDFLNATTKKVKDARDVFFYIGYTYLNETITKMSSIFRMTQQAGTVSKSRGFGKIKNNESLLKEIVKNSNL